MHSPRGDLGGQEVVQVEVQVGQLQQEGDQGLLSGGEVACLVEPLGEVESCGDADLALEQRQQHLLHVVHFLLLEALAAEVRQLIGVGRLLW